jgi:uncharacterized protein
MTDFLREDELRFEIFLKEQGFADAAHDIAHIHRVVKSAKKLCAQESAETRVVIPAAWLHDCVAVTKDSPLRSQASRIAADRAVQFLQELNYDPDLLPQIHHAIEAHSFSAGIVPQTLEAKIVQDADRLDAIGAVGLARCLMIGGSFGSKLYNPDDPFCVSRTPNDTQFSVDHFFAKLLKLQDLIQTNSGRVEAKKRTQFLQAFLDQLADEIE